MLTKSDLPFTNAKQAVVLFAFVIAAIFLYRKFAPQSVQTRVPV